MKWFLRLLGVLVLGGFILGAGETWNFETPVLGEVAVQARLRNLTCSKTGEEPHPRACYLPPTLVSL